MLYKQVMQELKNRIDSDEFAIGDTLPTEKALVEQYSVSRITIRKAIEELVKLGLVEKRQGAGTTIIG
ncbi:GntR family transcriptional regulator, partial [Vibrio xuii]